MRIDIKKIKPNPTNDEIYTSTDLSTLKQSLERNGQLEPIVINKDNTIISGHRRYFSILQLGWKEIEVRVAEYENETIALIYKTNSAYENKNIESNLVGKENART